MTETKPTQTQTLAMELSNPGGPRPDIDPVTKRIKLTLADTCDYCGTVTETASTGVKYSAPISRAYVRVYFSSGYYLDFCGHHYHVNEVALAPYAVHVEDTRELLNVKLESGYA